MQDQKAVIFYGMSGSGKGTQAKLLIEKLNALPSPRETIYLETGARIREFINDNAGYTRDMVKAILEKGGLLPEFVPISIWSHLLLTRYTGKEHLIMDGVARRPHEAPIVETALKFYGFTQITVFAIDVSKEWAREKLKNRGRYDDDDAEIDRRFSWYEKNTRPSLEYFKSCSGVSVIHVNGERPISDVHQDIISGLGL